MKALGLTFFMIPFVFGNPNNFKPEIIQNQKIVLELFTSQGCSSCPPADKLLKQVKSDDVIVLSYHVDYWNYIGWKDPFSKKSYSKKQEAYAYKFDNSTLYTPQVVINGKEHFVGSNKTLMNQKISAYSKVKSSHKVSVLNLKKSDDYVNFDYKIEGDVTNKNLRIALVINERITKVKRGENSNRTLINNNIVINEQVFEIKDNSGKGEIQIPTIANKTDDLSVVIILQNEQLDIFTADQKTLK